MEPAAALAPEARVDGVRWPSRIRCVRMDPRTRARHADPADAWCRPRPGAGRMASTPKEPLGGLHARERGPAGCSAISGSASWSPLQESIGPS